MVLFWSSEKQCLGWVKTKQRVFHLYNVNELGICCAPLLHC